MHDFTSDLAGYCYRFSGEFFPDEILKFETILFLCMSKFSTFQYLDIIRCNVCGKFCNVGKS